jgi:nucleotidyltransferase/DNA polymerase involved in DNA repair
MKSIGNENTFDEDTDGEEQLMSTLMQLCESVAARQRTRRAAPSRPRFVWKALSRHGYPLDSRYHYL